MSGGIRIAQVVCSDAFAGVERYVAALSARLAERGSEVFIIGGAPGAMTPPAQIPAGGSIAWEPAVTVRDAVAALRRLPPVDLINTHMTAADLAGLVHTARPRRPRLVSTRHFAAPRGGNPLVRAAFGLTARRFDAEIAISEYAASASGANCQVIRTGVDNADVPADSRRDHSVLLAQRLEPEKDGETAIRAWALSAARRHGWTLRVAGDGAQRRPLEGLAVELGVADSVEFLGHRPDVTDLMARSAVLLAPTPREGLGLSVLEAMARATPVVASDAGGHRETVGAVEDAAMFPPGDAAAAAAQLDRLCADPAARVAYGERLQARQRAVHTIARQVDATLALYGALVGSAAPLSDPVS
jgi:glycosyltransferase involved in cell wall biosynthesis